MRLYKFLQTYYNRLLFIQRNQEIGGTGTIKHDFDIHIFMGGISTHIIVARDA